MDLEEIIRSLTIEHALEAGQLYALELGVAPGVAAPNVVADDPIVSNAAANLADIADLARLLLFAGAADPEQRDLVARSVDGAGQKQIIFGGAEIIALAALLVTAYHIKVTGGAVAKESKTTIETKADGSATVTQSENIKYGISARLAGLIHNLLPGGK